MYGIKEIDAAELSKQLENLPENVKLIDVRTPAEVARGKISGSENLPLHVIPLKVDEFSREDTIIFYCQTGARSAQACAFMTSKGVDNVYNLRGGIVTWARMGLPIAG
ncbi:MAG: rhodanese-like domain-containing protein [Gammaproteobacteria bacterium]|nr:rhodanese-like domain-containing protein [Gammaproteobacteria bacterium]